MRTDKGKNGLATDENAMTPEENEKTVSAISEEDPKVFSPDEPLDPDDMVAGKILQIAKSEISDRLRNYPLDDGRVLAKLFFKFGLQLEDGVDSLVTVPEEHRKEFIECASADPNAFDLLALVLSRYLKNDRLPPRELRDFLLALLKRKIKIPSRGGRPPSDEVWKRDFIICDVVSTLVQGYDLNKTRNEEQTIPTPAASDYVYHALKEVAGLNLSFKSFQNILNNAKKWKEHEAFRFLYFSDFFDDLD